MWRAGPTTLDPVSTTPNDLALIQYTSGSTGSPKGVCLTHDNLVSNCEALGRNMGDDPDRVGFSWLPPYHDMGLMGTIFVSMFQGVPLVLMSPMHFVQAPSPMAGGDHRLQGDDHRGTELLARPVFRCAETTTRPRTWICPQCSDCTAAPSRSAPTRSRGSNRSMAPLGFDLNALIPCYGMAEATLYVSGKSRGSQVPHRASHQSRHGTSRAVVSCGEVDTEHTVRIVDPTTLEPLNDGQVGEIWVSGRSVAAGYYNRH